MSTIGEQQESIQNAFTFNRSLTSHTHRAYDIDLDGDFELNSIGNGNSCELDDSVIKNEKLPDLNFLNQEKEKNDKKEAIDVGDI